MPSTRRESRTTAAASVARRLHRHAVRRLQRRLVLSRRQAGDAGQGRRSPALNRDGVSRRLRQPDGARLSVPHRPLLRRRRLCATPPKAVGLRPAASARPRRSTIRCTSSPSSTARRRSPRRATARDQLDWDNLRASVRLAEPLSANALGRRRRCRGEPPRRGNAACRRSAPSRRICGRTARISTSPAASTRLRSTRRWSKGARCRRSPASRTSPSRTASTCALRAAACAAIPARSATSLSTGGTDGPVGQRPVLGRRGRASRRRPQGQRPRSEGPVGAAWRSLPGEAEQITQRLLRPGCARRQPSLPLRIDQRQGDARLHPARRIPPSMIFPANGSS